MNEKDFRDESQLYRFRVDEDASRADYAQPNSIASLVSRASGTPYGSPYAGPGGGLGAPDAGSEQPQQLAMGAINPAGKSMLVDVPYECVDA